MLSKQFKQVHACRAAGVRSTLQACTSCRMQVAEVIPNTWHGAVCRPCGGGGSICAGCGWLAPHAQQCTSNSFQPHLLHEPICQNEVDVPPGTRPAYGRGRWCTTVSTTMLLLSRPRNWGAKRQAVRAYRCAASEGHATPGRHASTGYGPAQGGWPSCAAESGDPAVACPLGWPWTAVACAEQPASLRSAHAATVSRPRLPSYLGSGRAESQRAQHSILRCLNSSVCSFDPTVYPAQ